MKPLFAHSLYQFDLLDEVRPIVYFTWTAKTADMDYEDFQEACNNYAGFAWQHQCKHLLVNTCEFQYSLPPEFHEWREKELNPRYYQLGVQKFAYIVPAEMLPYMKDIPAEMGRFETRNFTEMKAAVDWLLD